MICARGRQAFDHVGNARFRTTLAIYLPKYQAAHTKAGKTAIVSDIVELVHICTSGRFVRFDRTTNLYTELGDAAAREKVAQSMRDAVLKDKSSQRRKANIKRRITKSRQVENTSSSDDSLLSQLSYSLQDNELLSVENLQQFAMGDEDEIDQSMTFHAEDFFRFSLSIHDEADIPADLSAIFDDDFSDEILADSLAQ